MTTCRYKSNVGDYCTHYQLRSSVPVKCVLMTPSNIVGVLIACKLEHGVQKLVI